MAFFTFESSPGDQLALLCVLVAGLVPNVLGFHASAPQFYTDPVEPYPLTYPYPNHPFGHLPLASLGHFYRPQHQGASSENDRLGPLLRIPIRRDGSYNGLDDFRMRSVSEDDLKEAIEFALMGDDRVAFGRSLVYDPPVYPTPGYQGYPTWYPYY